MDVHDDFLEQLAEAESRDASRRSNASTASSKKSAASSKQSGSSSASAQAEMPSHRQGTPAKAAAKARGGATPNKGALKESNGKSTPAPVAKAAKAAPASAAKPDAKQAGIAANKVEKEITEFGFKSLGPIAAGAFSTILKAKHVASGNEVAVKSFLRTTGEQQEEHEREMDILRKLSGTAHAHIANLLGEYETPSAIIAILYLCNGGSLKAYLGKLAKKQLAMVEPMAAVVTAQIASALQFLHGVGIAHRDIKPANVLYDGQRWRLCDFGFAIECGDKRLKKPCGTLQYSAPEILTIGTNGDGGYLGPPVDLWAFGCLVYEMRLGRSAFVSPDVETLKLRIKNGFKGGSENHPWLPHMTKPYRALVMALLEREPDKRLSAEKVVTHKWITTHVEPNTAGGEDGIAAASGGHAGETVPSPPWWCDVAGEGCLRPTEPKRIDEYSCNHRCWHLNQTYMVCEASALEIELAALKAKHQAGSRLEAVLMELDEERGKNMVAQAALRSVQHLLEEGEVEAAKEEVAKIVPAPSDAGEES